MSGVPVGHTVTLDSGAKVTLWPNAETDANVFRFVSVEGEETWLKVSDAALDAMRNLIDYRPNSPMRTVMWVADLVSTAAEAAAREGA